MSTLLLYCIVQFNLSIIEIIELEIMIRGIRIKDLKHNNFVYDLLK